MRKTSEVQEWQNNSRKRSSFRFLLIGFFVVVLMHRMMGKSKDATLDIANFYIERMNVQITSHFQAVIAVKLSQVESIVNTMPPEGELQGEELKEAMIASGVARKFRFLGLMDGEGNMEVLFGGKPKVVDQAEFITSLRGGGRTSPGLFRLKSRMGSSSWASPVSTGWILGSGASPW